MTMISLTFTASELDLLSKLASDQLFRKEFIDPKLPGYKTNPAELRLGKELVARLRSANDRAAGIPTARRNGVTV